MVSIPKIIGVIACSVVLGLSVSNATQAITGDPCAQRKGGQPNLLLCDQETRQGIETIKGEVLRVDGNNYLIERFDGKEVTLHIEQTTKMSGRIGQGDRIEAKVGEADHLKHVLSLRQLE
ncbi:MAG TPA: hypothetical protein VJT11_07145 [Nitrospiraceae bacterium]|nr:hypothetical protein [Nitrospiraceae bacterium]